MSQFRFPETVHEAALDRIMQPTANIVDRHCCLAALAYADRFNIRALAVRMYLKRRLGWLNWYAMTQRQWQRQTKRSSRARHHDSIELREEHVRCHDGWPDREHAGQRS